MLLTATDAGKIALEFLMADWNIAEDHREWFMVFSSRPMGESWYIVELGVAGFPDRWFIQVYDTAMCDPNYTFVSPIPASEGFADFVDVPEMVAEVLMAERKTR